MNLNCLPYSQLYPLLSACASLFGNHAYNHVPLAPPGTKVVAHTLADNHSSFAPHMQVGVY